MANEYVIVTDSGSDLSKEMATELGIRIVPLSYKLDDGEPVAGDNADLKEFYSALRSGSTAVTSAAKQASNAIADAISEEQRIAQQRTSSSLLAKISAQITVSSNESVALFSQIC